MNKKYWISGIIGAIVVVIIGIFIFVSRSGATNEGRTIKLASSPGPYSELFLKGIKPILEKEGYHVQNRTFTDLLTADTVLNEGQVDLNVDQHTAYLNNFNKEKKGNLTPLVKIPTVPMGIYPAKRKALSQVKKGDNIALSNDPSNTARAYQLLAKAGWIKLKKDINPITATKKDIVQNKYHLKFDEIDSSMIPRVSNNFDYVILPGSVAYSAKVPSKSMLLSEKIQSEYYLVATTTKNKANTKWAKAVEKAYRSKAFADYVKKHNGSNYWVIPK